MSGIPKVLGYTRYEDEQQVVVCPRAETRTTPCIARDGALALSEDEGLCVSCGCSPWQELVNLRGDLPAEPASDANELQQLVRRVTAPQEVI